VASNGGGWCRRSSGPFSFAGQSWRFRLAFWFCRPSPRTGERCDLDSADLMTLNASIVQTNILDMTVKLDFDSAESMKTNTEIAQTITSDIIVKFLDVK
jgi:hypothetical protein